MNAERSRLEETRDQGTPRRKWGSYLSERAVGNRPRGLALGSTLPRISYLTRADRFFVGSAILVFLGLVKAVAVAGPARARARRCSNG